MARVRTGGGSNGAIWGMVVFGAGFFVCMILAIVFYTQLDSARQDAAAATAELNKTITSAEANNAEVAPLISDGQPGSVVGKLLTKMDALKGEVSRLDALARDTQGRLSAAEANLAQQQAATTQAQNDYKAAVDNKNAIEQALNKQVQDLSGTIQAVSDENTRLKGLVDKTVEELDKTYSTQLAGARASVDAKDNELAAAQGRITDLLTEISNLRGKPVDTVATTSADARIVAQIPDQDKVYLNIGRNQNLVPGMSFQVFDGDDLVKIEDPAAVGKAIVEVINVDADSAVGRIVDRLPRVAINDGDALVNVVYDPNRVFNYHVFGQFDLNYDGTTSESDLQAIRSMVTRFGGRLTDDIGFDTDYLVLGVQPEFPEKPADELDLIQMREYRVLLENYQAYQDRITKAQELGIPVLNQNRFLQLVGYFER